MIQINLFNELMHSGTVRRSHTIYHRNDKGVKVL